jgi:hypothetical protein
VTIDQLQRAAAHDAALIDALTDSFAEELAEVVKLLTARIRTLMRRLETGQDGRIAATTLNLQQALRLRSDLLAVLQQAGYGSLVLKAVDEPLDRLALQMLRGMPPIAAFDVDALVALKEIRLAELLQVGEDVAVQLWRITVDGVVGSRPVLDLIDDIADLLDISERRARTVYDTAVSTYSRQVGQLGSTGEPDELFYYVGPNDDKTREFCQARVGKVFTRAEIEQMDNGQLPDVMLTGGGYNCRHQFKRVSPLDQELIDLRKAQEAGEDEPPTHVEQLTEAERKAVEQYTFGGGWKPLNEALRDGRPLTDAQKEMVRLLDSAIAKAPPLSGDTTMYRGVNFGGQGMPTGADLAGLSRDARESAVRTAIADWAEKTYQPGDTFQLGGFQSTSRDAQPALDASLSRTNPGVIFEIDAKKGLDLTGLGSKSVDDEREVLLSRFTTYRVDSVVRSEEFETATGNMVTRTVVRVTQIFGGKR